MIRKIFIALLFAICSTGADAAITDIAKQNVTKISFQTRHVTLGAPIWASFTNKQEIEAGYDYANFLYENFNDITTQTKNNSELVVEFYVDVKTRKTIKGLIPLLTKANKAKLFKTMQKEHFVSIEQLNEKILTNLPKFTYSCVRRFFSKWYNKWYNLARWKKVVIIGGVIIVITVTCLVLYFYLNSSGSLVQFDPTISCEANCQNLCVSSANPAECQASCIQQLVEHNTSGFQATGNVCPLDLRGTEQPQNPLNSCPKNAECYLTEDFGVIEITTEKPAPTVPSCKETCVEKCLPHDPNYHDLTGQKNDLYAFDVDPIDNTSGDYATRIKCQNNCLKKCPTDHK